MSGRYTKLFSLPENLYAEGSPVIIEAGVLTLDNNTNRVFVQLKFRNISDKEIKALSVTLKAYYVTGKEASEPVKYQYLDFCSNIDEEFGAKTPILLHDNTVRSFSVHIDEVVYYDNTVGEVNLDYSESIPAQNLLCKTDGWNKDTASEFKKLTDDKCVYAMCEYKDLWLCSCGCANSLVRDKRCCRCGCAHDFLKSITPEKAQAHINDAVYDDAVSKMQSNSVTGYDKAISLFNSIHGWKDADDKAKECEKLRDELNEKNKQQKKLDDKRKKKKIIIASISTAVCIAFIVLLKTVIIPNFKHSKAIKLLSEGRFDDAYLILSEIGKTDEITENKRARAEKLLSECQWNSAYSLLKEIGADEDIKKSKQTRADELLAKEDYDSAYSLLEDIGNSSAIDENKYERAKKLIENQKYSAAYMLLKKLTYTDSQSIANEIYPKLTLDERIQCAEVGDKITFGKYEQDNDLTNGKEDIRWIVLSRDSEKLFLISESILDCRQYDPRESYGDDYAAWWKSPLRDWLDNDFYNSAFSYDEKQRLIKTSMFDLDESSPDSLKKEEYYNYVTLLSLPEYREYIEPYKPEMCGMSEYAKKKCEYEIQYNSWWLNDTPLTRGDRDSAYYIFGDSKGYNLFLTMAFSFCGVRPVVRINIK